MKKAAIILAKGFEEIEALSVVDILRRGDVEVKIVGLEEMMIEGTHGIKVMADVIFESVNFNEIDMIILPGGLPGATNLANSAKLEAKLRQFDKASKYLAAICAAPTVLDKAGVIKSSFTCYPGCESQISASGYQKDQNVVVDKNIITAKGPALAMEFSLKLLEILTNKTKANSVAKGLLA